MYSNFSQFGLYRYESGASRNVLKQQRSFHSKMIICSILAMSFIFFSLVYVLIHSRSAQPAKVIKNIEIKPKLPIKDLEGGIEVIELFGKNNSEVPKRIKRLDSDESDRSPDSQKLIFFPSRTLKPPRTLEKPKVINFPPIPPNHRMSSRMSEPRPFKHMMASGSMPNGFKVQTTARSFNQQLNNIHDVINQNQFPENQGQFSQMQNHFSGTQNQFNANPGQFSRIKNQLNGMKNQFPGNQGQFTSVQGQFPGNQGQFSGNQGQFTGTVNQQFPGTVNQYPRVKNQFPFVKGQFPSQQHILNQQNQFQPNQQTAHQHQFSGQLNPFQMNPNQIQMNQNQFPFQNNQPVKKKKQVTLPESSSVHPIQLAGTYRHPRKEKHFSTMLQSEINQNHLANQYEMPDPFYNFKPESALEVNQMVTGEKLLTPNTLTQNSPYFRRKFNHQIASIPNYKINSKDVTGIFQNVLSSGKKFQVDRNEMSKPKPLQLMLDVYPANGEEMDMQHMPQMTQQISNMMPNMMMQQYSQMPRLKPFQGYYQDPSYFNSMAFPQLMPRYPSYYRYPQLQAQSSNVRPMSVSKPSQLVVHLNLFPKDKSSFKRSSTENEIDTNKKKKQELLQLETSTTNATASVPFNINFNVNTGNGHPENINHHVNRLKDPYHNRDVQPDSTFRPSYYYDDNEENDQSIMVAPSLVYQNINRDRPIHLMLQNTSTTANPTKKTKNHKHTYQVIERPRNHKKIKNEPRNFVD